MAVEAFVVVVAERGGQRVGSRHPLQIPVAAARGRYEDLSDRALNDLLKDLWHEQRSRCGDDLAQPGERYDPFASQFTEGES